MDDCKQTINVSYPNEEPCEQTSASCVITEEAISYLGIEEGENVDSIFKKLVQSLIDARTRLKTAEETLSNSVFGFVTPGTTTLSGPDEHTLVNNIVGSKTFTPEFREEGKAYEVEVEGLLTNSSSIDSYIFNIKIGTDTIISLKAKESGYNGTNLPFKIKVTLLFLENDIFAYGTLDAGNIYYFESSTTTVDNSISENMDVTFTGLTSTDTTTASVKLKSIIN